MRQVNHDHVFIFIVRRYSTAVSWCDVIKLLLIYLPESCYLVNTYVINLNDISSVSLHQYQCSYKWWQTELLPTFVAFSSLISRWISIDQRISSAIPINRSMVLSSSTWPIQDSGQCHHTIYAVLFIIECVEYTLRVTISIRLVVQFKSFVHEWNNVHVNG